MTAGSNDQLAVKGSMQKYGMCDDPTGSPTIVDPVESATVAGLHYVTDRDAGIRRRGAGRGFSYTGVDGKRITSREDLTRIKNLSIPPAWRDVWISPIPQGHLQATGRDAKGRKQYIYHPRWRDIRDQTKFNRMVPFGNALPKIRKRVEQDLSLAGLARDKVLATVVRLLESTLIRIGNKEYARENRSFGLTTMRSRHLNVSGSFIQFRFRGKSGKEHAVAVQDPRIAKIVKRCRDIPGHELFQYLDEEGEHRTIDSADVNDYLKEITGEHFTAKEFRTWGGSIHAALALEEIGPFQTEAEAKRNIAEAVKRASIRLGNKPSICRKYYVHPAIIDSYLNGYLLDALDKIDGQETEDTAANELQPYEVAILDMLKDYDSHKEEPFASE